MSLIEGGVLVLIAGIIALAVLVFKVFQRILVPANSPRAFLRRGRKPTTRTVIVCAGDSHTHGTISNYMVMLEKQFAGTGCEFVNAGINGNLAWNVVQRLPDIIACQPDVFTLLVGTNDVNATFSDAVEDKYRKEQKFTEKPTYDWFRQNVEQIIDGVQAGTRARIAILTMPMLGEDLSSPVNQRVKEYNAALAEIAQAKGVALLPLHDRLTAVIPANHRPPPYDRKRDLIMPSLFKHYVLRQSWDAISAAHGFVVLTDHIHLNDRAAGIVAELISGFIKEK